MAIFTALVSLAIFVGSVAALPAPLPLKEMEPVDGNFTARDMMKRAGATVYSCTVPNTAALTFDDGPYIYNTDISSTLNNAGVKGTFFLNGNNWDCIYNHVDAIQQIYSQGHQFGSHTWSHSDLSTLSWDQIHDEMWKVELALQRIIGAQPAHMRPPYGSFNQLVVDAARVRGQDLILWDFDSGDSNGVSPAQSKREYTALANRRPNTVLALNHETYASTAYDVLPHAIRELKRAGYQLVTVAECLGQQPYQWVGSPQNPGPDWHC